MTTTPQKVSAIYAIDDTGNNTDALVAQVFPAQQAAVDYLLAQEVGDDGRSEWQWVILQNGDVMLGLFPTGDEGYFGTEIWRDEDWKAATS